MLDEFRSTSITWDKATRRIYSPITANESDENGRKLVVQIVNGGQVEDLTGSALHLYWETRDKLHDGLDVFKAVDLKKGEFELSYTTGMLSNQGVLNANLVLIDTVGRVVSERFKITVTEGIDNDAIQSENSFSSLTKALIDISNLEQNYAPRLNDLTAQLQQTDTKINAVANNKVGDGVLAGMGDLDQEVKTAMTGGSVAVIGEEMVSEVNLANDLKFKSESINNIGSYINGDDSNRLIKRENLIGLSDWSLTHSTVDEGMANILYIRPTSGNYGAIHTSYNKLKFTNNPGGSTTPYILVGISDTTFTLVGIRDGGQAQVVEAVIGTNTVTTVKKTDSSIVGANGGDELIIELTSTHLKVDIKRVGEESFNKMFDIDLSALSGLTGWQTKPTLGLSSVVSSFGRIGLTVYGYTESPLQSLGENLTEALFYVNSKVDSLSPPENNLLGVPWASFGDSTSFRNYWQPYIVDRFGLNHTNCGQGGTTLAYYNSASMATAGRLDVVKAANPKIVTILGGANDLPYDIPIGDNNQFELETKDRTNFKGGYSYIIESLLSWKPELIIILMTTTYAHNNGDSIAHNSGLKYTDYAQATRDVANYYNLLCVDLMTGMGVNKLTQSVYTSDNIHHNDEGAKRIANLAIEEGFNKLTIL